MIAKAALRDIAASKLAPSQLGFGVPLGAEAAAHAAHAAHAARCFLTNILSNQALLKLDFSNAFNTLYDVTRC